MRELKFRAWHKKDKIMWWWNILWGNCGHGGGWIGMCPIGEEISYKMYSQGNRVLIDPDSCEIMQFTDLQDKNSVDIYEGDIVKFGDPTSDCYMLDQEKETAPVEWYQDKCAFMPRDIEINHKGGRFIHHWDWLKDVEVIGNIHEDNRLIKKDE